MLPSRLLQDRKARRHPDEAHAYAVWMARRPDVFRRALLECSDPPGTAAQIESVDRAMENAFDAVASDERSRDVAHLMDRALQQLKREWKPKAFFPSLARSGGMELPEQPEPRRKILDTRYLR